MRSIFCLVVHLHYWWLGSLMSFDLKVHVLDRVEVGMVLKMGFFLVKKKKVHLIIRNKKYPIVLDLDFPCS